MIKLKTGIMLIVILGLFGVTGCGGSTGPAETYLTASRLLEEGKVEKAMEYIQIPPEMQVMVPPEKMKALLVETTRKISDKGGISKIEVVAEKITGLTAVVITKESYGNGEVEDDVTNMINVDGVWKIEIEM